MYRKNVSDIISRKEVNILKHIIAVLESLVLLFSIILPKYQNATLPRPPQEASYQNLGIPLAEYYPDGCIARTPWDIEVFNGMLYVGGGDYDANSGPVPIYCFDINGKEWLHSGTVPDEQIEKFKVIQGRLMAPGCDPRQDWSLGNIYELRDAQWVTNRSIPGGIHQFDIIEYDGKIFAALGVVPGQFPIAVSGDGGQTFQQVTLYKNGLPIDTTVPAGTSSVQIRVYDFFILNDNLYAYYCHYIDGAFTLEIYQYHNNAFYYYSDMPNQLRSKRTTYRTFDEAVEFDGNQYFTTGNLYISPDMKNAEKITISENCIVTDLRVIEDSLYALTAVKNDDETYRTAVWCKAAGNTAAFRELFYFDFPCPAQCFTYHNGTMYFGMGDGILSESDPNNGTILSVYVLG